MIFLDRITTIPTTIDIKIPTSAKLEKDSIIKDVDCGDAENEGTIYIDGGDGIAPQLLSMNCGWADIEKESIYTLNLDNGFANSNFKDVVVGGFAGSVQKLFNDGGGADDTAQPKLKIGVVLKHITTDKVYLYKGVVKEQNSLYIVFPFEFNEVPPVGQYDIVATNGEKVIFKGILQIGKIENKNKSYKIINNGEQHEI